ncbi:site-specific DNA-methyltransferase, partial [Xanthomonas oryzae]|uniref:site-specific DNA-methyltransferase n=1 Tax=Xanthomonas oryzae TaxID=347 RepID=UPI00215CB44B
PSSWPIAISSPPDSKPDCYSGWGDIAGGRILDPFAGSGTTLVAAELEGYRWTVVEMTQHYAEIAQERLAVL